MVLHKMNESSIVILTMLELTMTITFCYILMMRKGDNMKNLNELCNDLCETLTESMHTIGNTIGKTYFSYKVGQKYIKIISNDNDEISTLLFGVY